MHNSKNPLLAVVSLFILCSYCQGMDIPLLEDYKKSVSLPEHDPHSPHIYRRGCWCSPSLEIPNTVFINDLRLLADIFQALHEENPHILVEFFLKLFHPPYQLTGSCRDALFHRGLLDSEGAIHFLWQDIFASFFQEAENNVDGFFFQCAAYDFSIRYPEMKYRLESLPGSIDNSLCKKLFNEYGIIAHESKIEITERTKIITTLTLIEKKGGLKILLAPLDKIFRRFRLN